MWERQIAFSWNTSTVLRTCFHLVSKLVSFMMRIAWKGWHVTALLVHKGYKLADCLSIRQSPTLQSDINTARSSQLVDIHVYQRKVMTFFISRQNNINNSCAGGSCAGRSWVFNLNFNDLMNQSSFWKS